MHEVSLVNCMWIRVQLGSGNRGEILKALGFRNRCPKPLKHFIIRQGINIFALLKAVGFSCGKYLESPLTNPQPIRRLLMSSLEGYFPLQLRS